MIFAALQPRCCLDRSCPAVRRYHAFGMFLITEADADAIRAIFNQEGGLSDAIK
jgi:hypothetical protein